MALRISTLHRTLLQPGRISLIRPPYPRPFLSTKMSANIQKESTEKPRISDPLFPSHKPTRDSPTIPVPLAGITDASSVELSKLLRMNYEKFHCFFNEDSFHNHLSHHLFAVYWFGGTPQLLRAAYDLHASYQRPSFESPGPINLLNWKKHLGDEAYYNAYLKFFTDTLVNSENGVGPVLEKYIFSEEANDPESCMLDRFLSGLAHPMIHFGYGVEFDSKGVTAEGLAITAVHTPQNGPLIYENFFQSQAPSSVGAAVENTLEKLTLSSNTTQQSSISGEHSFTIVSQILEDPRLSAGKTCQHTSTRRFTDTLGSAGDIVASYTKKWTVNTPDEVNDKVEELSWLATLVYGLGGFRKGHDFRADFFLAHLVTSSIFLPSIIGKLSFPAQSAFLRAYFGVTIGYWISRGRPQLPIADFYEATNNLASQLPQRLQIPVAKDALGAQGRVDAEGLVGQKQPQSAQVSSDVGHVADSYSSTANLFLPVAQSALHHPDEHLTKAQRSFYHFASLYGKRPSGFFSHAKGVELKDAALLDGTFFLRVAFQTMKAHGWVREGQPRGRWDRRGLGWDELW